MGKKETNDGKAKQDPEAAERRRLKRLAVYKGIISEAPAKASVTLLSPSKVVVKHRGKDIVKKSQRKNRFLFSFSGLLAPVGGGKIGSSRIWGLKTPFSTSIFPRGGAGSTNENKSSVNNLVKEFVKEQTLVTDVEDDSSKSENNATELIKQTPTRHSARTSGKTYKFAETFSSDDESDADISILSDKKSEAKESNMISNSKAKEILTEAPKVSKSSSHVTHNLRVQVTINV